MAGWRVLSVVGNPKPQSRTRQVAEAVAERVVRGLTAGGEPGDGSAGNGAAATAEVIEVSELGAGLLGWGDPAVKAATTAMAAADVLIVATPTYKATYTGLLKLLLDQIGAGELGGVPTIPVQVAAAPQHALAVEVHLRPVLVEIGASLPTTGLFVLDSTLDTLDQTLDQWSTPNLDAVIALATARAARVRA
ncbi:NAD(P)H-dependent oxidoreductase [Frankia sp. AgB1.9]|uniref:NADPH-dependent FMN reductase n=1 Tax=unclassified Frankia TaxID=2632575 RepID=UPI0019349ED6|nr:MULTISPECIES: NAD(P)H-dependent oxidoreductase [unclassified Frankia]MBL7488564.1 NAD(P)H-dependent oxidoreductase [Frankia sp. AgW1.1]MBL7550897.1 NAD(P)H-dependent oxidoreductase [Frankia sp. AgB1.9]MBL7621299.1 NAD(P)H-dependent oxidoreductase [Frankia sp. AgB1.8]